MADVCHKWPRPHKPTTRSRARYRIFIEGPPGKHMSLKSDAGSYEEALQEAFRRWDNVYHGMAVDEVRIRGRR